jgi:uncharacterized protein YqeY
MMNAALREAMVNKDTVTRDVVRLALAAVKQAEVDQRRTLSDDEVVAILNKEVKTRRESLTEAENAGRTETVNEEKTRLAILERFLPQQLTRDEVVALAQDAVAQSGATSAKEMGKVMAVLMPKVRGLADGKMVNDVVRELLSS